MHTLKTPVTRRSFIRSASLASAAAVAFPHVLGAQAAGTPTPNNRLNVACIGVGGRGEAALMGMLQSCSPGLAVVNIDNGVGAGATAALIARGAAE